MITKLLEKQIKKSLWFNKELRSVQGWKSKKNVSKRPCKIRENRGRGLFTAAGQTVQRKFTAGEQSRCKKLPKPLVSFRVLQYTSTSSELISSKNQVTTLNADRVKHFIKNWKKIGKRSCDLGGRKVLRITFCFSTLVIKRTKSG